METLGSFCATESELISGKTISPDRILIFMQIQIKKLSLANNQYWFVTVYAICIRSGTNDVVSIFLIFRSRSQSVIPVTAESMNLLPKSIPTQ